ncbi:hypothetical protein [Streptomyces mirabilis]|uniref:hypothetical protein n=1 Tax=Streptomyces mirabilis TaxID=68239 RepID=UPI0036884FE6
MSHQPPFRRPTTGSPAPRHTDLLQPRGYTDGDARADASALDTLDDSALDDTYTYLCAVMDVTQHLTLTDRPVALGVSVLDHDGLSALLNCLLEDPR